MNTRDAVLAALEPYGLKQEGANEFRCNRPWSSGSDSQGLVVTFDDDEHGCFFDHVSGSGGSLYQLAQRLNVEIEHTFEAQETKQRYEGLAEYALAHGSTAEIFAAAGWRETRYQNRPALEFPTKTGKRWRFIDGEEPRFKSEVEYRRTWYGLPRAAKLAADGCQPLILCNGEPSVVVAQAHGLTACAVTAGENSDVPAELVEELRQAWQGEIILAPDCDETGRKWAKGWLELLTAHPVRVVDFHGSKGFDLADFCKLYTEDADIRFGELPDLILEDQPGDDDTWQVFTMEDALKPRPERVHIVEGLLDEKTLNIPYGAPGCYKTFLFMDMAVCIAGAEDFLPPLPNSTGQGRKTVSVPVIWVDFDMGEDLLHERFAALLRGHELTPDIPLFYYSMPEPWLVANNLQHIDRLINRILRIGAKVLFVDHLKAVSAEVDENSDKMQIVMSNFRRLVKYTEASTNVLHHQRKNTGVNSRAGEKLRGHGSIEAALDLALVIERENMSDDVTVISTKSRRNSVYPFGATFTYEHDEKGLLYSAKFFGVKADDDNSDFAIDQAIVEELKTGSMNQSELTKAIKELLPKVGMNRIRIRIQRLEAFGNLTSTEGSKNAIVYGLK